MLVLSGLGTPCPWQQEPGWALFMVRRDMSVTAERPERSHPSPPGPIARPDPTSAAHGELPFPKGQEHTRQSDEAFSVEQKILLSAGPCDTEGQHLITEILVSRIPWPSGMFGISLTADSVTFERYSVHNNTILCIWT